MSEAKMLERQIILPCPFCGENPIVEPENPELEGNAWARVICKNRNCAAKPYVWDRVMVADERGSDIYKLSAIILWNTRAK